MTKASILRICHVAALYKRTAWFHLSSNGRFIATGSQPMQIAG